MGYQIRIGLKSFAVICLAGLLPLTALALQEPSSSTGYRATIPPNSAHTSAAPVTSAAPTAQTATSGAVNTTTKPLTVIQKRLILQGVAMKNPYTLQLYKPNYILPVYASSNPYYSGYSGITPAPIKQIELKGQFSFLFPLFNKVLLNIPFALELTYTQMSYWQVYAESQFFRETNYEPSLLLLVQANPNWYLGASLVHQSNGLGGTNERSWNRAIGGITYSGTHWMVRAEGWGLILKKSSSDLHNSDIAKYLGHSQLTLACSYGRFIADVQTRNLLESGFKYGSVQADIGWRVFTRAYLYLQDFNGYGQSLFEYKHRTNSVGVGVALNSWV